MYLLTILRYCGRLLWGAPGSWALRYLSTLCLIRESEIYYRSLHHRFPRGKEAVNAVYLLAYFERVLLSRSYVHMD